MTFTVLLKNYNFFQNLPIKINQLIHTYAPYHSIVILEPIKAGEPITEKNYQFHVNIEYNYEKQDWLEGKNELLSQTQKINRQDWANSSLLLEPLVQDFPIFHDYLMFELVNQNSSYR